MTYSMKVRASTRAQCKQMITTALLKQTQSQAAHNYDRAHVERLLHALVDAVQERTGYEIVCDAYGYVNPSTGTQPTMLTANVKVYSVAALPDEVPLGEVYRHRIPDNGSE
jgi:hypothetical protein